MKTKGIVANGTCKTNVLHLAMIEAKKRSGLSQTEIAARLGMPQSNVSRIEHSEVVSFNTFIGYLMACGFDFTIAMRPVRRVRKELNKEAYK